MQRRGFIGAVCAVFAGLWAKPAKAEPAQRVGQVTKFVPVEVPTRTTLPITPHFNPNTDQILVVHGGVIPSCGGACSAGPVIRVEGITDEGAIKLGSVLDMREGCYPRTSTFELRCIVQVGTVDQLVEDYRKKLELAVKACYIDVNMPFVQQARRDMVAAVPKTDDGVWECRVWPKDGKHPAIQALIARQIELSPLQPVELEGF